MSFTGRTAFITGGGAGIGLAFAEALAARGTAIVIADIDPAVGASAAEGLRQQGAHAIAVPCDVADEQQVQDAIAAATSQLGGVDICINNAGKHLTKYNQPFGTLGIHELRALLDVNVVGVVACSLAAAASMRERGGGSILNVTSIAAAMAASPYGVSKLAARGLTMALAKELAPDRIRVNGISPGVMQSSAAIGDLAPEHWDQMLNLQLIKRRGTVADLVGAMLYLCSDEASFVTGETITVSGGWPLYA
jgi:3-oxoacyl-[acyl-carrier protein] reductase